MSRKKSFWQKNKSLIFMTLLSFVLAGIAIREYSIKNTERQKEKRRSMVLGIEDINRVYSVVREKDGDTVRLERQGDHWLLQEPVKDLAETFTVEAFISDIISGEGAIVEAKRDVSGAVDWSEYGLDKNTLQIKVTLTNKKSHQIEFSEHSAFDGSFFARYDNHVWVVDKSWSTVFSKSVNSLRDQNLYRTSVPPVRLAFQYLSKKSMSFILQKDVENSKEWKFVNQAFKVDQEDVQNWFADLKKLMAAKFLDNISQLKAYGIDRPYLALQFDFDDGTSELWKIGRVRSKQGEYKYYIQKDDASTLVEVNAEYMKKIFATSVFFREGHLPFRFSMEQLQSLTYSDRNVQEVKIQKDVNGQWQLDSDVPGYSYSEPLWQTYLQNLSTLNAEDFLNSSKKIRTSTPMAEIELHFMNSKKTKKIQFLHPYTSQLALPAMNPLVSTMVNGSEVFGVEKSKYEALQLNQLLSLKKSNPNESGKN